MSKRLANGWSSKKDILEDLAEVTGRCTDVDEQFIAVGQEPPPAWRHNDDNKFNMRYLGARRHHDMRPEPMKPDLLGITQMLRMLDDDEIQENVPTRTIHNVNDIVTISKLNPSVPAFVPKSVTQSSPSDNVVISGNSSDNDDVKRKKQESNEDLNVKSDVVAKTESSKENTVLVDQKLNADEIQNISLRLRNKISDVYKKGDLQTKKEKNVAIAALLKLHTTPLTTQHEEETPIKLITPDYYITPPTAETVRCQIHDVNIDSETNNSQTASDDSDRLSEKKMQATRTFENEISTQSGKSSTKSYIESPNTLNHFPQDPDVQKSIKKVTRWLEKPESSKPKGPVVCLGPISFKKKIAKSPDSSKSSTSSSSVNLMSNHQIRHFVPSKRAEDLSKKYAQRGRALENQSEDMWTRAMNEMKAIDKKKEMGKLSRQSDICEDNGSSSERS